MTKEQQRIINEYYRKQGIKTILCKHVITNRNNVNFRITEIPYTVALSDIMWYFVDGRLKNYRYDNRLYKLENIFMPSDSNFDVLISLDGLKRYINDCGINPNVNHTLAMYVFKSIEHVLTHDEYAVPSMSSMVAFHQLMLNCVKITATAIGKVWDELNTRLAQKYGLDIFAMKTDDNSITIPQYASQNPQVINLMMKELGEMIYEYGLVNYPDKYIKIVPNGNGEILTGYNPDDDSSELK